MDEQEEQEQSQESKLAKQAGNVAKQEGKKAAKAAGTALKVGIKKLISSIGIKYFAIAIGVVLLFVLVFAAITYVIKIDDGSWKEESSRSTPYIVAQEMGQLEDGNLDERSKQQTQARSEANNTSTKNSGNSSVNTTPTTYSTNLEIVKDDTLGYTYKLDLDKRVNNIISKLKNNTGRIDYYIKEENQVEYMKTFIMAEFITQYPDIRSVSAIQNDNNSSVSENIVDKLSEKFYGAIKVRRYTEGGEGRLIDYIDLDTFNSYIDSNNSEVLNHFSLTEDMQIIVAQHETSRTTVTSQVPEVVQPSSQSSGSYSTSTIDYKTMLAQHSMPFDFLWNLLVMTEDEDFVYKTAELALKSDIEIGVYDNITYVTETKTTDIVKNMVSEIKFNETETKKTQTYNYTDNKDYSAVEVTYSECNIPTVAINKAHTWVVDYDREFTYDTTSSTTSNVSTPSSSQGNASQGNSSTKGGNTSDDSYSVLDEEYVSEGGNSSVKYKNVKIEGEVKSQTTISGKEGDNTFSTEVANRVKESKTKFETYLKDTESRTETKTTGSGNNKVTKTTKIENPTYNIEKATVKELRTFAIKKMTVNTTVTTKSYTEGQVTIEEKTDKETEGNFVNLFANSKSASEKLMSAPEWFFQILQRSPKAANMEDTVRYLFYKATGKDLGVTSLNLSLFDISRFSSVSSSYELLKQFIRYYENYTGKPAQNAEGTMYKIIPDSYGVPTCGFGVNVKANKAIFEAAGMPTGMGEYVSKEFVDKLEDQIIQDKLKDVRSITAGLNLTEYQINALASRAYQAGTSGGLQKKRSGLTFVEAYKKYWKESDDLYDEGALVGDFNHQLFTEYMKYPTDSSNGGIRKRKKSEWTLFQTGFYDVLGQRHSDGGVLATGGEGTLGVYRSSTGKTFNLYLQYKGPWKNEYYGNSGSMRSAGCGPTAEAIIASGYNGNITPSTARKDLVDRLGKGNHSSAANIAASLRRLVPGIKCSTGKFDVNKVKQTIQSGGQVWLVVGVSKYTSGAHCIALIDYKDPGKVYVAHGSAGSRRPYGWDNISYIKSAWTGSNVLYVGG